MHQVTARIVNKQEIAQNIYRLTIFAPLVAGEAKPGQFVHIRCGQDQTYLLRRPFSIHQITGVDTFEILVRTVGPGSLWLANRKPVCAVDLLGPLGTSFNFEADLNKVIIVAGGIGIAPLLFLTKKLAEKKIKMYTLMGAASRSHLLDFMDLKRLTRRISVTTEDGSQGHKGLITDILSQEIEDVRPDQIFACGPIAMLKNVVGISRRHGVPGQVSLEARMACGIGACLGCAVKGKEGYLKVCSDGPVFNAEDLGW